MNKRQALLIRVGIDSSYGKWNAPVNPEDGTFFYVPIPEENDKKKIRHGYEKNYLPFIEACKSFGIIPPQHLECKNVHLDPDFEQLTYGDENQKSQQIKDLREDDIIAFYAGLKPIKPFSDRLYYALIGLYVVDKVLPADKVCEQDWDKNAHTRRAPDSTDYIVFAKTGGLSGRLERCILIGEWKDKAYRLKSDIIDAWGGIDFNNGYIQRSARIPRLNEPEKFYKWFQAQDVSLIQKNI